MEKVAPIGNEDAETPEAGSPPYKGTSVYFEPDVLAVVDAEAVRDKRSRSFVVNQLLREALKLREIRGAA